MDLELLNQPIHPNVKRFIIPLLRRRWIYWPARGEAIKLARVAPNQYKCNICKREDFRRDEIQVDHIAPVQELGSSLKTWYDLIIFIIRLYADTDKLQVLDRTCHKQKTDTENLMRKFYKKQNKPPKKTRNPKKRRT